MSEQIVQVTKATEQTKCCLCRKAIQVGQGMVSGLPSYTVSPSHIQGQCPPRGRRSSAR